MKGDVNHFARHPPLAGFVSRRQGDAGRMPHPQCFPLAQLVASKDVARETRPKNTESNAGGPGG